GIQEQFGKKVLPFVDFDDQQYQLISVANSNGVDSGITWEKGPIPLEYTMTRLRTIVLLVTNIDYYQAVLQVVYFFKSVDQEGDFHYMETGEGGNGASIIVEHNSTLPRGRQGFGTIHHVAFRVDDKQDLEKWIERYQSFRVPNSGFVE